VWNVYDTMSGALVTAIRGEGQGVNPYGFHHALLDDLSGTLYVPFVSGEQAADGPLPLRIARYDLETGVNEGEIELSDVLAGVWYPNGTSSDPFLIATLSPGIALSPDGSQIAIVAAATGAVSLIDTSTFTLARTFVPERRVGLLHRIAAWLAPLPGRAEAKMTSGTVTRAFYSADSQSLYVSGRSVTIDEDGDVQPELLGIQRIAIADGTVAAVALGGSDIEQVWVAPDGSAIYALGYDEAWELASGSPAHELRRLDPASLEIIVERSFPPDTGLVSAPV
jgi:hypothetical protein